MTCKETNKLIHSYLDGELDAAAREVFDRHVAGCMACSQEVFAYREIEGLMGALQLAEAPTNLSEGVIRALRSSGRIKAARAAAARPGLLARLPGRWRIPVAAVAVFLVAAVVFPATIGKLTGLAGKSAVIATDTYIGVQETAGKAGVLRSVVDGLAITANMFKTLVLALVSVVATLGNVFKFPVLAVLFFLTVGAAVYVRFFLKRGAHHASFSI